MSSSGPDLVHRIAAILYAPMPAIMRLLLTIHFRRVHVRRRERFPRQGAALVIANHPSTWTDVLVLQVAFGRKLHFLAHEGLFQPPPRAWLLHLFGSLPVAREGPGHEEKNEFTFRRCRDLLADGEAIAVFPEGVSADDRSVQPFHMGAARIVLDQVELGNDLAIVPVGIHYGDRAAFRDDVVINVGRPIQVSAAQLPGVRGRATWIPRLTIRMQHEVERLIVSLPDPAERLIVEELAPFLPAGPDGDPGRFVRSRRLASRLKRLRGQPGSMAALERRAERERAWRQSVSLKARHLGERVRKPFGVLVAWVLLEAPLGVAGLVLNAMPAWATCIVARRETDPTRVVMTRILAGLVLFSAWYAGLASMVLLISRSIGLAVAAPAVAAGLGVCALHWLGARDALRASLALDRRLLDRRPPRQPARIPR